jgi:hypothetical protein
VPFQCHRLTRPTLFLAMLNGGQLEQDVGWRHCEILRGAEGHGQSSAISLFWLPQQPKKMAPPESSIVVRYCPGQLADGLLARGNISRAGRLGKEGEEGEGCWQAVSIATLKQSERPIGRAIFIG